MRYRITARSLTCVLVAYTWSADKAPLHAAAPVARSGDMICGPRCVKFLLQHYGKDEDLIELVKETQWPDFEAGATLSALQNALETRGIHTKALRVSPDARLNWQGPCLVHLKSRDGGTGHYVVWLPSSTSDRVELWSGLSGVQSGAPRVFRERRSGLILLTSAEMITNADTAVSRSNMARLRVFVFCLLVSIGGCLLLAWLVRGFRRRSIRPHKHPQKVPV